MPAYLLAELDSGVWEEAWLAREERRLDRSQDLKRWWYLVV